MTTACPVEAVSFVVLAKELGSAKTRLGLDRRRAEEVALRLAATCVLAAVEAGCSGAAWVVTSDPLIAEVSAASGAAVIPEGRPRGMNKAGAMGRDEALHHRPASPVAVMVADLPLVRPHDLDALVAQFRRLDVPLFVPDHQAVGTTMLIHGPESRPGLAFGRQSALMHRRMGYWPAKSVARGLRFDLDIPEDFAAAWSGEQDAQEWMDSSIPRINPVMMQSGLG